MTHSIHNYNLSTIWNGEVDMSDEKADVLELSREEIERSLNTLIKLFEIAADLQQYCGAEDSDDVYEALCYEKQYDLNLDALHSMSRLLKKHDFNLTTIYTIALNPRKDLYGRRRIWMPLPSEQEKLPKIVDNWKELLIEAENRFNS